MKAPSHLLFVQEQITIATTGRRHGAVSLDRSCLLQDLTQDVFTRRRHMFCLLTSCEQRRSELRQHTPASRGNRLRSDILTLFAFSLSSRRGAGRAAGPVWQSWQTGSPLPRGPVQPPSALTGRDPTDAICWSQTSLQRGQKGLSRVSGFVPEIICILTNFRFLLFGFF